MSEYTFKLKDTGGNVITMPRGSCDDLQQNINMHKPSYEAETLNGTLIVQSLNWSKLIIEVSGSGHARPYFDGISDTNVYSYYSFSPIDIFKGEDATGTITVKYNVRNDELDYSPMIIGVKADGSKIEATIDTVTNNIIDFTFTEPVVSYNVIYYPIYAVRIRPIDDPSYNQSSGIFSWKISMRTV